MLDRFKKENPFSGFSGFGGGGLGLSGGSSDGTTDYTMTLNNPTTSGFTFQGSGLGSACSTTNRVRSNSQADPDEASSLRFEFSPSISTITEFELCVTGDLGESTTPHGLNYKFNDTFGGGGFTTYNNTNNIPNNTNTVMDLTSAASSAAPISNFNLQIFGDFDYNYLWMWVSYIKINGVYVTGTGSGTGNNRTYTFSA